MPNDNNIQSTYKSQYTGKEIDEIIGVVKGVSDYNNSTTGLATYPGRISALEYAVLGENNSKNLTNETSYLLKAIDTCLKKDALNTITRPLRINESKDEKIVTNNGTSTSALEYISIDSSNRYLYPVIQMAPPKTMMGNQYDKQFGEKALYYIQDTSDSGYTLSLQLREGKGNTYDLAWNYYLNGKPQGDAPLARITNIGQVYGAVWNDYAEFRQSTEREPGRVICENDDGSLSLSVKRLQPCGNIISDTFGFAIGQTGESQTPVAVSGRVLAYTDKNRETFKVGDCVCTGPNGTVSRMNRIETILFPDRIIGIVSEIPNYDYWGLELVPVKNRIWIKIK